MKSQATTARAGVTVTPRAKAFTQALASAKTACGGRRPSSQVTQSDVSRASKEGCRARYSMRTIARWKGASERAETIRCHLKHQVLWVHSLLHD